MDTCIHISCSARLILLCVIQNKVEKNSNNNKRHKTAYTHRQSRWKSKTKHWPGMIEWSSERTNVREMGRRRNRYEECVVYSFVLWAANLLWFGTMRSAHRIQYFRYAYIWTLLACRLTLPATLSTDSCTGSAPACVCVIGIACCCWFFIRHEHRKQYVIR